MRIACAALVLLALTACSKPAEETAEPASAAAPPPVVDTWPGTYEGDVMVRIKGAPSTHTVVLVEAEADGCSGDIGLAGGEPAHDVSANELSLTPKSDSNAICTIRIVRDGDHLTVSEDGICTAWHGLTCTFNGKASRVK